MAVVIQFRRDNAAVWASENPILAEGEIGVELDTDLFKIGDGSTAWNDKGYAQIVGPKGDTGNQGPKGDTGDAGADGADGRTILNGSGAPAAELGVDGDLYLDTSVHAIYGPKTGGSWGSGVSLIGPQGDKGDQGAQGDPGTGNLNFEGDWTTATVYHVNDVLKGADNNFYRCTVQHTSGSSNEPGVGESWEDDWELFGGGGGGDFLVMQVFN